MNARAWFVPTAAIRAASLFLPLLLAAPLAAQPFGFGARATLNANAASDSGYDRDPWIASDGGSICLAVWRSNDSLGGTIGTDDDVLYAVSNDAGSTWSAPAPLNSNAATDSGDDGGPRIAWCGGSTWLAVWHSEDALGGTIGLDADILFARSTDGGASWSAPAPLNDFAAIDAEGDGEPALVVDAAGNCVVAWQTNTNLAGGGFDGDIAAARSSDAGATWSAAVVVNSNGGTDSGTDSSVVLAMDGAGVVVAAWYSNDSLGGTIGTDFDILTSRSLDFGATWSPVQPLNANAATAAGIDALPAVATDGAGVWLAVWNSTDPFSGTLELGGDNDVLLASSTDNGATWTAPSSLNANAATDAGADNRCALWPLGGGEWLAAWVSTETLGGTIGVDSDILVATTADDGATWTFPQPLDPGAATDAAANDLRPAVARCGSGRVAVAWYSNNSLGATIGVDDDLFVAVSTTLPVELSGAALE